jgi:tellurite methyltransferase
MEPNSSVHFFETQFQKQVLQSGLALNPFEQIAIPYLHGRVLDYGCGLGNLAVAAAQRGCSVVALDASPTAIEHLRCIAREQSLPIEAAQADLRSHSLFEDFDCVVSIGLLMFFDCATAYRQLHHLQSHLRPGGVAVINVLVEGTTYLEMFDPKEHCLFARDAMRVHFPDWEILYHELQDFAAPKHQVKSFVTLIARKPN